MSSNITTNGYTKLRKYVTDNWRFIELRDASSVLIGTRFNLQSALGAVAPAKYIVEVDNTNNKYFITITFLGSDTTLTPSKQIKTVSLYDVATGGDPVIQVNYSTPITIYSVDDKIIIKLEVEIPKIV